MGKGSGIGRTVAPTAMGSSTASARSLLLAVTSAADLTLDISEGCETGTLRQAPKLSNSEPRSIGSDAGPLPGSTDPRRSEMPQIWPLPADR